MFRSGSAARAVFPDCHESLRAEERIDYTRRWRFPFEPEGVMLRFAFVLIVVGFTLGLSAAPVPKTAKPVVGETNSNSLVKAHKDKLKFEASSEWEA